MFQFMVNADGGLTTAGYAVCIAVGVALFGLAIFFAGKSSEKKKMSAKQLVFCAMAVALAFITSYLKIFHLPWGGSVTLCSMALYCAYCQLVRPQNRCNGRSGLRNPAVYPGTLCAVLFPGVLRLCSCFCGAGSGRLFCKKQPWTCERLYCSSDSARSLSCTGRISILDELHAGKFPPVSESSVSDCL